MTTHNSPGLVLTGYDFVMQSVGNLTAPQHSWYAHRNGYEFLVNREYSTDTHPSWQKLALLKRLLPLYPYILWLDADTVVTNPSIRIEEIIEDRKGLIVSTDWTEPAPEDAIKHFSMGNFVITNDPESFELLRLASQRTEWANDPLWEQQAMQEEYRANPGIRDFVHILPRRVLNSVPATPRTTGPEPWRPGDFLCHYTYQSMADRVKMIPLAIDSAFHHLVPDLPSWHDLDMCMDVRHIAMLRDIFFSCFPIKHALEIGTWEGSSTAAFTAALDNGRLENYTGCDIYFREGFLHLMQGRQNVRLREQTSDEVLSDDSEKFDLIFCDGAHTMDVMKRETEHILRRSPRIVVAHDTRATKAGYNGCEGAAYLEERLRAEGWYCYVDDRDRRPHEQTRRGFLAATKSIETSLPLQRIFAAFNF